VIGFDRVCTADDNTIIDMLETHLAGLRANPRYKAAVVYVYVEANMSFVTANRIKNIIDKPVYYPTIVAQYDPKGESRYGVWSGPEEKEMYADELKRALADGQLCYAEHFVSQDGAAVKSELKDQMEVFRRELKVSPTGKKTYVYTGKSNGRKDDLCIVLQMLLYWSKYTRESSEYANAATQNGWRI
jgi:hypothetical protein